MGVMDRYNEKKKKKEESKGKSTSGGVAERYERNQYYQTLDTSGVDENYINTFISDTNSFFNGVNENSLDYDTAKSTLGDLSTRYDTIQGWLYKNKSKLNAETYSRLSSTFNGLQSSFAGIKDYYSQWGSAEDYSKSLMGWLDPEAETNEKTVPMRQAWYKEQQKKVEDLDSYYNNYHTIELQYQDYQANPWAYTPEEAQDIVAKYEQHNAYKQKYGSLSDVKAEIEAIEAENRRYAKTQGVLDRYYTPETDEFMQSASNRNYTNASREELWAYDVSTMEGSVALSNGGSFDEDGNILDAGGNIVQSANAPVVEDKLGLFLSVSDEDITTALNEISLTNGNYTNTWANLIREGDLNGWKYLSPYEVNIYYDLYNREGQEAAYRYLDAMTTELTRRATKETTTDINNASMLEQIGWNLASIPMNVFGGVASFVDDVSHIVQGEDINPYSRAHALQNAATDVRTKTAEDINALTGNIALPWVGTTFGDVYQSLMSAADSATGVLLGGNIYGVLMGTGAASSEMKKLYEKGASIVQIATGGILAGAAEMVFEKYSIDKLVSMGDSKTKMAIIINALKQGGIEASEEIFTEIANTITNVIVMGSQSDWQDLNTFVKNVVNAGIGGFISGSTMGGIGATAGYLDYGSKAEKYGQSIMDKGGVDAIQQLAADMSADKSTLNARAIGNLSDKVSKKTTAKNVGKLADLMGDTVSAQNASDIAAALEEKGLSKKEAKRVAEYLNKAARGEYFTDKEAAEIESDERITEVYRELIGDRKSSVNTRTQNLSSAISGEEYRRIVEAAQLHHETAETIEEQQVAEVPKTVQTAQEKPIEAPVTTAPANDQQVTEESPVAEEAETKTVTLDDVSKKYGAQAQDMISTYTAGQDVAKYDAAYQVAYDMGRSGVSFNYVKDNQSTSYLTDTQKELAYKAGQAASNTEAQALDAKNKADGNGKTGRRKGVVKGEGVTISDLKKTFNDTQSRAYKYLSAVAEATGIDIVLYRSEAGTDGKFQGAQGRYSRSEPGTIYIDLNAGLENVNDAEELAKYAMLRTFSHEFTHFIEKWNPIQYNEFRKVVFDTLTQRGENVNDLIENKQAQNPGMSYDKASREVVAEAMTDILPDSNFVQELAVNHKTIFQKLLDKLKEFVENLREYFNSLGMNPSREANVLKEQVGDTIKYLDNIVKLFDQAALQAVENYQQTVATEESTQEVNSNERREETREAFLGRAGKALLEVEERGTLAYGYRHYNSQLSPKIQAAKEGLTKIGIPVVVFEQMEANKDGVTTIYRNDAMAIPGVAVFVHKDATVDALEIVGHEGFHFFRGSANRDSYNEVLVANIDFASEAFINYQQKYVEDIYFADDVELGSEEWATLMEEIFAYITGDIHAGDPRGEVHAFLRDYDTVKSAVDRLFEKQTAPAATESVEESAPVVEKDAYGFTISDNVEHGSLEITFDSKPSDAVRDVLKENKFRWHKAKKVWYGYGSREDIQNALHAAYEVADTADEAPEQSDFEKSFWNATQAERDEVVDAIHENTKISHIAPTEIRESADVVKDEEVTENGQNVDNQTAVQQPESDGRGAAPVLDELQTGDVPGDGGSRDTVADPGERGQQTVRDGSESDHSAGDVGGHGERSSQSGDLRGSDRVTTEEPAADTNVGGKLHEEVTEQIAQQSTEKPKGRNFVIGDSLDLPNGEKARYKANIEAIRLVKQLEAEGRYATEAEQVILSKYVGWGGLANAFDQRKAEWSKEFAELKELLTDEEYSSARGSTLNAHYTDISVIKAMYDGLKQLGFTGGRMMEPSSGVGNFVGAMPADMASQVRSWTMVELDGITGLIAKYLYPNADVRIQGFEKANIPNNFMDVAISNVPFGNYAVVDKSYPKKVTSAIHNYFFAKSLDKVRPGGIVMFITSSYTMNSSDSTVRRYIMQKADLLGAIRLPDSAFKGNAGTEVVTDILVLKKRADNTAYAGEDFLEAPYKYINGYNGAYINSYFENHPEMVLGTASMEGGMYRGGSLTYKALEGKGSLADQIREAFKNIQGKMDYPVRKTPEKTNFAVERAGKKTKNNGLVVKEGKVYQNKNGELVEVNTAKGTAERITGMLEIRDAAKELQTYLQQGLNDADIRKARAKLNKAYDAFVKKHGFINAQANKNAIKPDPDSFSILALENWNPETKKATKADIFSKNTIAPNRTVTSAKDVAEGLIVSVNQTGGVDAALIAKLTGKTEADVTRELLDSRAVFKNRDGGLETAEVYLSGNVRAKLRDAEAMVPLDADYQKNVEALKAVMPEDVGYQDIFVNPGTPWIPNSVYSDFAAYMLGGSNTWRQDVDVTRNKDTGNFTVELKNRYLKSNSHNTQKWGTNRRSFLDLFDAMLNSKSVVVKYKTDDGKTVVDQDATAAANEKVEAIQKEFQEWLWKDEGRRNELATLYNETFNSVVTPKYNGDNLTVNGANAMKPLRPHQRNAVQRVISSGGNTLLAHKVGAGKTYEMAAAAMKLKELGLVKKPLFAVPKSLVAQWGNEFMDFFPTAKLLVAEAGDFTATNRKIFANRIANGDYDAVIVSYEQFEKLPISADFARELYQEQIESIIAAIEDAKAEKGGKSLSVKDLEKKRKSLQTKIEKLTDSAKDDDNIEFEQLGVDSIFVDEAHNFKNLFYTTSMTNVSGLGNKDGSKRAFDLYTKVRYLQKLNGGRGIVFATATPVMNSMSEMYIMQKYLQPDLLDQLGLNTFDAWAKQFGEVVNGVEIKPSGQGYRVKQSFSRFKNMSELQLLFRNFADVLTDIPGLKIPKMKGGRVNVVVCEPGQFQQDYMKELEKRADNIKSVDPSVDNMLKITSDGRKISYTQRMIDPTLPYEEGCKIFRCADNVVRVYQESSANKGTQLIFCDMATPKGKSKVAETQTEEIETDMESAKLYDDIKARLMKGGIPAKEIAFIHEADTDAKKKKLFADVNDGKVRVLIGSTGKMGVGMNAQKRIVAIHHLDAPWRPGDVEQRNGRAFRQGNINDEVENFTYVTEGSFDARLWDILDRKQSFINQVMNGENVGRETEDTGEVTLSAAEVKALASGSPLIMEQVQLDTDIKKLESLRRAHRAAVTNAMSRLQTDKGRIATLEKMIENGKVDSAARVDTYSEGKFSITIGKQKFTEKKDAGVALMAEATAKANETGYTTIGKFAGFDLRVIKTHEGIKGLISGKQGYSFNTYPGNTTYMVNHLVARVEEISEAVTQWEQELVQTRKDMAEQEMLITQPFAKQAELDQKRARYNEVMEILNPKEEQALDSVAEDDVQFQPREYLDDGTKFFMRDTVEETRDLVAFHNITPQLLKEALKRNGLVMPSVAVTNKGMTDFGEISLLFDKSVIDPAINQDNKLYGADAWTPMQTTLKKNAKFDTDKTVRAVNAMKTSIGSKYVSELLNITPKQFKEAIIEADGNIYEAYAHNIGVQAAYGMESGIISQIPTNKDGTVNREMLQKHLDKTLDTDEGWRQYRRWLNNISDTIITSYDQATNEDVLNHMKKQPATSKTFKLSETGDLVVPAVEYASIKDLRRNKNRLSANAEESAKAVASEFLDFAKKVGDTQKVVEAINASFGSRYNIAGIMKSFSSNGIKISSKEAGELQALYKKAVELPARYFEAKPGGVIGLNKVNTAVVPPNTSTEIRHALEDLGITVLDYDGSNESRVEMINSVKDIQFQQRTNTLTDREVLALAANQVNVSDMTTAEKDALDIFQQRLSKLETLQAERAEQGRLYKEQQFGAKVDRAAAAETLNRMHVLDSQIQKASAEVLTVEEKNVLKQVLQKARTVVEQQQWTHDQEILKRWRDRRNNADAIKKYRDRLKKDVNELTNWVLHPNNKDVVKHIPDVLKSSVIPFLSSIDFTSKKQLRGGDATKADKEFMKRLNGLKAALKPGQSVDGLYGDYSDLPPNFMDRLQLLIDSAQAIVEKKSGEFVVNQMTSQELRELSQVVRTLKTYIQQFNRFHENAMFQHVSEAGDNTISELDQMDNAGPHTGGISSFVFWQQMRPAYAWERFGEGGKAIYDGLRRGQAKLAFNTKIIVDFSEKAYTEAEVKAWEKQIHEIQLGNDIVKMPVSTIMSFYELSKRPQALGHIIGQGVRVATYKAGGKKISDIGHTVTMEDVQTIIGTLTDRQKEVADNLQKFMQEQGGKWGNYVSVKRFGEELFGEDHYFPINSDGRHLAANADEHLSAASLYALLNMGFTKSTTEGANNRLVLYSIFDVFANHMASMAQYNALALPVVDALKWFNYQQKSEPDENGQRFIQGSVRDQMDRVYGVPEETRPGSGRQGYAQSFVINIIKAFNGTEAQGTPYDGFGMKHLHNYNRAQVAYNLRVVVQQPMAITRAAQLLDYGAIIKGMKLQPAAIRKNIQEMQQYSGIAAWKSLGFYDVNISRGLTSIIKHDDTWMDKVTDVGMWGAEKADTLTWASIWSACKEEVIKKQKLTPNSDGFYDAVTQLFEDVIYKTQVVDSVLTKNEYMRDKGFFARSVSSFMSESVTTASMLIDAYDKYHMDIQRGMTRQQAWKKNSKNIVRTAYVFGLGAAILAAVQAVADAFRDDDDYEEWYEKWLEAFGGNLVDELVPFNKLPIVSDFYDLSKALLSKLGVDTYGNPPQSVFMQWYDSLVQGVEILYDKISGADTNYTWYGGAYKLLQAASGMTGLPMAGVTREIITAWNNIVGAMAPSLKVKTYDTGEENEIKYAYQDGYLTAEEAAEELLAQGLVDTEGEAYFTVQGWAAGEGYSRYDSIFDAVRNGGDFNTAMNELTSHGYTEKDVLSQVKSKIGEWYKGGEITKQQATQMLGEYVGMANEDVTATVNKWSSKVVTGIAYEDIKAEYLAGNITTTRAIEMRMRYGGETREDAQNTVGEWKFEAEHPELDGLITYTQYKRWEADGKPNGVSLDTFTNVAKFRDDGTSDSVKSQEEVAAYINALHISTAQKDALWCCFWKKSTLKNAPWH